MHLVDRTVISIILPFDLSLYASLKVTLYLLACALPAFIKGNGIALCEEA